jgi:hypothetical protein
MSGEGAVFFLFYFPYSIFDFVIFLFVYFICVYRSNLGKHFYAIPKLNRPLGFVFSVTLWTL